MVDMISYLGRNRLVKKSEEIFTDELKRLLETKHLYQSTTMDLYVGLGGEEDKLWRSQAAREKWGVRDNATRPTATKSAYEFTLDPPDVKLFCDYCRRVEAFNSISSQEATGRSELESDIKAKEATQVFVFSFLCQSCKRGSEVFLLRREGLKLTLCGRAPMETADFPNCIPETVRRFYSSALLGHQSGQTLAGLFLLRTLIEQWARSKVQSPAARADELMDQYMAMLPKDFNDRFPSMRSLYDDISADLHTAEGFGGLFDRALTEITEHFDARRVFKL